jgi:GMP synthase-like glutamine amidotransferase
MKPIAILRHVPSEGPGYLADFIEAQNIPWQLIRIDAGEAVPKEVTDFSGVVFMGGPMSVNDDLPWIKPALALIRNAVEHDIPVLGHCLGSQLMSQALGGVVTRSSVKEIGWGRVTVSNNDTAREWFGDISTFEAFHWHGETFSLPQDAIPVLSSEHCANQGFVLGKHLALQCHVEMTAQLIGDWCEIGADEISASKASPAVQTIADIHTQMADKLPQLTNVARQLYQHWVTGLVE